MHPILLVDDDVELCQLLSELLGLEGFEVSAVHDGLAALELLNQRRFSIIILDVMMPRLNGFDTLRRLREHFNTPVLMMSARGEEVDRIVGLEIGADDYLPKPCSPRELIARIRAMIRRIEMEHTADIPSTAITSGSVTPSLLQFQDLALDLGALRVRCNEQPLDLTHTELRILQCLIEAFPAFVTREDLMRKVLKRALGPFDRSLDMHLSNLRRKLGPYANGTPRLKTLRGSGYLLLTPGETP